MNINEKFIINLQGKSYVTYDGLLDMAHKSNLKSIEVDLIQSPRKTNQMTAICRATVTTNDGVYSDLGDASPDSVNSNIVPHLIRMASTRAKARALRDLTNVGMTAFEELSLDNTDLPTNKQLEAIKKLSKNLDVNIDYENLTKKKASKLISQMLEEIKNK